NLRDFASVTAHDLKAPLRQTSMFVGLLQNELAKLDVDLNESAEDALNGIHAGLDRMKRIVKSLYELFSVETLQTEKSVTSLKDVFDEATAQLSSLIDDKNARVEVGELPAVAIAPDYMVQVFQNLIANACKYSNAENPVITISYERDINNRVHRIEFSDNGPGIPVDMQDAVFEPYKRLHHNSEIDGNGIGLALCRRIMALHMGDIRLDPKSDPGACFILSLPLD
ncbi:MAG: ATP-binding protein, partial [Pseudomonadota bacterium]